MINLVKTPSKKWYPPKKKITNIINDLSWLNAIFNSCNISLQNKWVIYGHITPEHKFWKHQSA